MQANPKERRIQTCLGWLTVLGALASAPPLAAQTVDARVMERGLLKVGFEPHYTNWDRRFSANTPGLADGTAELLGTDFTRDTVGTNLFPSLANLENALRTFTGNPDYRINVGNFQTVLDADVRHFPFTFAFGLTNRLTLTAHVPIVTVRAQLTFTNDTTNANVGLNQAITSQGGMEAQALLADLASNVTQLQSMITGGSFGCPTGPQCAQAQMTLTRAMVLLNHLTDVTGLTGAGPNVNTFAPLASSVEGTAILAEIDAVRSALQTLGVTAFAQSLPLPTARVGADGVNGMLTDPAFGYDAMPLEFIRKTTLGDAELGLRFGLIQKPTLRTVLVATVRLPTGSTDLANNFTDLSTGDAQTDVELGVEAAFEPGNSVALIFGAGYTMQMPHTLRRRITSPDAPLVPASFETSVRRNLGDIIRLSAFPTLRLTPEFRVFGSMSYHAKQSDKYSLADGSVALNPSLLEIETKQTALNIGGGIAYRSTTTPQGTKLPIEAGLAYSAAFSGSGGQTAKTTQLNIYLRLFYRIFGGNPPE